MRHAGLILLLLLAACADPAPPPPAQASAPAAPAVPAPPVTRFDGTYDLTISANPDRSKSCPPAPPGTRELSIRQGRANVLYNPVARQSLSGTIGPDGDVRMVDSLDRTIATTGQVRDQAFVGEHRNGRCSYAVSGPRRADRGS